MEQFTRTSRVIPALVLSLCALGAFFATDITFGDPPPEDPPAPYTVSDSDDFNDDEVNDRVEADPSSEEQPGQVEVRSGDNGQLIVRIRGTTEGDRFGYSIAIIDLNLDGHKDLVIGAPKDDAGRVYTYLGPFLDTGPLLMDASDAHIVFASPNESDFDFGDRLAPVADLNGDGVPEIRIRAWFEDLSSESVVRTYIVSGLTGDAMYAIEGTDPFDPWAWLKEMPTVMATSIKMMRTLSHSTLDCLVIPAH